MNITIVDRWRSVRIAPTKAVRDDSDPFEVMRDLAKGHAVQNGQIVFECDAPFLARVTTGLPHDDYLPADKSGRFEPGLPGTPNVPVPTFMGIPIIVEPSCAPLAAEPVIKSEPVPPSPEPAMGATTKTLQENS